MLNMNARGFFVESISCYILFSRTEANVIICILPPLAVGRTPKIVITVRQGLRNCRDVDAVCQQDSDASKDVLKLQQ